MTGQLFRVPAQRVRPRMPRFVVTLLIGLLLLPSFVAGPISPGVVSRAAQESLIATDAEPGTFASFGYADRTMTSPHGSITYWLPILPSVVPLEGSEIRLSYRAAPGLLPDQSSLTVLINGTPEYTVRLGGDAGSDELQTIAIPLPTNLDTQSFGHGVELTVQASLRTTTDQCEPVLQSNRWLTILASSALSLNAGQFQAGPTLSSLPRLFTPPIGTVGHTAHQPTMEPVTIVLSPAASTEEIEAAGLVALAIGQWAGRIGVDPAIVVQQQIPATGPTVVVASGERFSAGVTWGDVTWNGERFVGPGGDIAKASGVLSLQHGTVPRLMVTGATRFAVRVAARSILDSSILSLLNGSHAVVDGIATAPPSGALGPWDDQVTTFQGLGAGDASVTGAGSHSLRYRWDRPASWTISDGSELVLAVSVGPSVQADSAITVRLNGQEIGTAALLTAEEADPAQPTRHEIRFPIPPDILNTTTDGLPIRSLDLDIEMYLATAVERCVTPEQFPFATILGLSHWSLPHDSSDTYDLARFPSALYGDDEPLDQARGLLIVVPNDPHTEELAEGLTLMAALGRWVPDQRAQAPRLLTQRWVSPDDRAVADLVLIGARDRNPSTDEFFRRRPSLAPELLPPLARPNSTGGWAPIILTDSPWTTGDAAVLVLPTVASGSDDAVASILTRREGLHRLHGSVALVAPNVAPQSLQAATTRTTSSAGGILPSNGSTAMNLIWIFGLTLFIGLGYRMVQTTRSARHSTPGTNSSSTRAGRDKGPQ